MTPSISVCSLRRRYRDHLALDNVSFEIEGPSITGLLGRNGAGKSTLMRVLAAQERPTSGTVRVLGGPVWENGSVLQNVVLVREDQEYPDMQVGQIIRAASWFHRNWCDDLAAEMLDGFELPLRRPVKKLSRGMRSALGIVIGLAARAEVTLLDEPYAGLDAVARRMFYDRLLADYAVHPRTVVLSTHLIDEAADLMEHVILMDHGRIIVDAPADDVRGGRDNGNRAGPDRRSVRGRSADMGAQAARNETIGDHGGCVGRRGQRPGPGNASRPPRVVAPGDCGARSRAGPS